jgi:hypothetical protein
MAGVLDHGGALLGSRSFMSGLRTTLVIAAAVAAIAAVTASRLPQQTGMSVAIEGVVP